MTKHNTKWLGRIARIFIASTVALGAASCTTDDAQDEPQKNTQQKESQSSEESSPDSSMTDKKREALVKQVVDQVKSRGASLNADGNTFLNVASGFVCSGVNYSKPFSSKLESVGPFSQSGANTPPAYVTPIGINKAAQQANELDASTSNDAPRVGSNAPFKFGGQDPVFLKDQPIFGGKVQGHQYHGNENAFSAWGEYSNPDVVEELGTYLRKNADIVQNNGTYSDSRQKFLMFGLTEGYKPLDIDKIKSMDPEEILNYGCNGENAPGAAQFKIDRNAASQKIENISFTFKGVFAMTAEDLGLNPNEFRDLRERVANLDLNDVNGARSEIQQRDVYRKFAEAYKDRLNKGVDSMPEVTVSLDIEHNALNVDSTQDEWWTKK